MPNRDAAAPHAKAAGLVPIHPGAPMIERVGRAIHTSMDAPMPRFVRQRWEDLTPQAARCMLLRAFAAINAMRYADGADEDLAIIVGRKLGLDPVMVIDCFNGMIEAAIEPRESESVGIACRNDSGTNKAPPSEKAQF